MDWMIMLIAGIAGTILMTMFINVWAWITGFEYRVPNTLGTLVTMSTRPSGRISENNLVVLIGYTLHFLIGIFFSLCYYILWTYYLGAPAWIDTLYLGFGSGALATLFWYSIFKLHPLAPRLKINSYLLLVFLGHFIFTAGIIGTWKISENYLKDVYYYEQR